VRRKEKATTRVPEGPLCSLSEEVLQHDEATGRVGGVVKRVTTEQNEKDVDFQEKKVRGEE